MHNLDIFSQRSTYRKKTAGLHFAHHRGAALIFVACHALTNTYDVNAFFYAGSGTAESYLNIYRNTTRHLRIGRCQTGPPRVVSDKYGGAVGMTVSCFLSEAPRPSILAPRLTFSRRFASAPSPLPRPIS